MGEMKIVVMVPTYREARNIPRLVAEVFRHVPDAHLLIVDDDSPDGTADEVRKAMPLHPGQVHLMVRTRNRGRGSAGIDGFQQALAMGADLVVEMDGDLSHHPEDLPRLIAAAADGTADIVVGSRYVVGGADAERGFLRRIISTLARAYLRCVTRVPLQDITSGYRVYRAAVLRAILPDLRATDPFIVTEVNVASRRRGFRFRELPISFHERYAGESKLTAGKLVGYLFKALRLMAGIYAADPVIRRSAYIIGGFSVARLVICQMFGLTDDEAHYWQYAMHPALSYLDHPPLIGYAIAASRALFGDTVFAVRLPAILAGTVTSFYAARITDRLFGRETVVPALVLLNLLPLSLVGGMVTVPDALLAAIWTAFLWYAHQFATGQRTRDLSIAAVLLGLAGLTKYTAVFLALGALGVMVCDGSLRRWLARTEFWVATGISLLLVSPVFLWNAAYGWASFAYQLGNRADQGVFSAGMFVQNVGAQVLFVSPVVWVCAMVACVWWLSGRMRDPGARFLGWFSIPLIVFFLCVGTVRPVLPHWPAVGYVALVPLIAALWRGKRLLTWSFVTAGCLCGLMVFVVLIPAVPIPDALRDQDTPDKLFGWPAAGREMARLLQGEPDALIVTSKPYTAGQLRFSLARFWDRTSPLPEVRCFSDRVTQYQFWNGDPQALQGRNAFAVVESRYQDTTAWIESLPFDSVQEVSQVRYRRSFMWPERSFTYYRCTGFSPQKLQELLDERRKNMYIPHHGFRESLRAYDIEVTLRINRNSWSGSPVYRWVCLMVTNIGNGWVMAGIMLVALLFVDRGRYLYNAVFFLLVSLTGGGVTQLFKFVFDTARPLRVAEHVGAHMVVIGEELRNLGFPSGHTFLVFSAAVFLSARIRNPRATVALFCIAAASGFSRILVGAHFVSDVVGGVLVGVLYTASCLYIETWIRKRVVSAEQAVG